MKAVDNMTPDGGSAVRRPGRIAAVVGVVTLVAMQFLGNWEDPRQDGQGTEGYPGTYVPATEIPASRPYPSIPWEPWDPADPYLKVDR